MNVSERHIPGFEALCDRLGKGYQTVHEAHYWDLPPAFLH